MEDVNKQRRILFLFLHLDMVPRNSAPGGFAYICNSKWVAIIRTQIHFLSDVLIAVESLDLKVSIILSGITCNATLILAVVEYVRLGLSTGAVVTVFTFACSLDPGPS